MTGIHDLAKENSYYFFGPSLINRLFATTCAVTVGTLVSMPFDMIRLRLHTMRPLPNGEYPYHHTFDALIKVIINQFESIFRFVNMNATNTNSQTFNHSMLDSKHLG